MSSSWSASPRTRAEGHLEGTVVCHGDRPPPVGHETVWHSAQFTRRGRMQFSQKPVIPRFFPCMLVCSTCWRTAATRLPRSRRSTPRRRGTRRAGARLLGAGPALRRWRGPPTRKLSRALKMASGCAARSGKSCNGNDGSVGDGPPLRVGLDEVAGRRAADAEATEHGAMHHCTFEGGQCCRCLIALVGNQCLTQL